MASQRSRCWKKTLKIQPQTSGKLEGKTRWGVSLQAGETRQAPQLPLAVLRAKQRWLLPAGIAVRDPSSSRDEAGWLWKLENGQHPESQRVTESCWWCAEVICQFGGILTLSTDGKMVCTCACVCMHACTFSTDRFLTVAHYPESPRWGCNGTPRLPRRFWCERNRYMGCTVPFFFFFLRAKETSKKEVATFWYKLHS